MDYTVTMYIVDASVLGFLGNDTTSNAQIDCEFYFNSNSSWVGPYNFFSLGTITKADELVTTFTL